MSTVDRERQALEVRVNQRNALSAHEAATNPHPTYATDADLLVHTSDSSIHGGGGGGASEHVLATGSDLGPLHTMSGAAAGQVLRAYSATQARFDPLDYADLAGVPSTFAPAAHTIDGAAHTGAITSAQHGTIASGNLHPEYATDADLTAHAATSHGVTDHGALAGLADDDHTQYVLVAGDTMTGTLQTNSGRVIVGGVSGQLELNAGNEAGLTPFIDFHYSNAGADYTARIIAEADDRLSFRFRSGGLIVARHSDGISGAGLGGLTAGHVLRATSASGFSFGAIQASDLPAIDHGGLSGLADDDHPQYATDADLTAHAALATHHAQAHVLNGADHTVSGLTPGHVLTALTATTFGFQAPAAGVTDHGLLSGLADDDHNQYVLNTGDTVTGNLILSSGTPRVVYNETDAAVNNRMWDWIVGVEAFMGRLVNDADSAATAWVTVQRTANVVDSVTFPVATVSGALTLHGAASVSPTTWAAVWTNVTIGNASVTYRYERIGKRVFGHAHIQFGSTSAFAGGSFAVSAPVTAQAVGIRCGAGIAYDQSANSLWTFTVFLATTGTFSFQFTGTGGAYNVASAAPFAWAQLDQLSFEFQYEAA